jgi:Amt family ammonium transporter
LLVQAAAVGATAAYAFVSTLIIYKLVDRFVGVRVAEKDELLGLDLSQHREAAYTVLE